MNLRCTQIDLHPWHETHHLGLTYKNVPDKSTTNTWRPQEISVNDPEEQRAYLVKDRHRERGCQQWMRPLALRRVRAAMEVSHKVRRTNRRSQCHCLDLTSYCSRPSEMWLTHWCMICNAFLYEVLIAQASAMTESSERKTFIMTLTLCVQKNGGLCSESLEPACREISPSRGHSASPK